MDTYEATTTKLSPFSLELPNLVEFCPTKTGYKAFEERYPDAAILTYYPSASSSNTDLAQKWDQVSHTCQTTIRQHDNFDAIGCNDFGFAIVNCEKYPTWNNCKKCDATSNPCMLTWGRIRGQSLSQYEFQITSIRGTNYISIYLHEKRDYIVKRPLTMPYLHQVLNLLVGLQDLDSLYASSGIFAYHPQNEISQALAMKWNSLAYQCQRRPQFCTKYFGFALVDCSSRLTNSWDLCRENQLPAMLVHEKDANGHTRRTVIRGQEELKSFMNSDSKTRQKLVAKVS